MNSDDTVHLSATDCEALLYGALDPILRKRLETHLEVCTQCGKFMNNYQDQDDRLRGLRVGANAQARDGCPDRDTWLQLAAGIEDKEDSATLLDHAATCDFCGAYFRMAVEDLNSTTTPREALQALSSDYGRTLAAELRSQRIRAQEQERRPKRLWLPALAMAAVVILGVFWARPVAIFGESPEQLLAQAFETSRTWTLRFPGAEYAPPETDVTRSLAPRSTKLEEASLAISRGLVEQPESPRFLALEARLKFLRRDYDGAIQTLERLAEAEPTAALLSDLGTVYAARGMARDDSSDYELAVEYLSRALQQNPKDSMALFNRALALEGLLLWNGAEQDWKDYLALDASSGWAEEARQHLQSVEQKKKFGGSN